MARSQFTFYESYARAISRIKDAKVRCVAYDILVAYALRGEEPDVDRLPESVAMFFDLIQPTLEASARKSENGKKGGSKREANGKQTASKTEANDKQNESNEQTESKDEANVKQTASKKENENEIEKENEVEYEIEKEYEYENECYISTPPTPAVDSTGGAAVVYYLNHVNPSASPDALEAIGGFAKIISDEAAIHAMDIARDEHKPHFSYIKAILQRYMRENVRSLADVERLEQEWEARKTQGNSAKPDRYAHIRNLMHEEVLT